MFSYLRDVQPVNLTGILTHIVAWIKSSSGDLIYHNPQFNVDESVPEELGEGIAVYCIHGLADKSSAFKRVADRIVGGLHFLISSINLVSFHHRGTGLGIDSYAEQLVEKIKMNGHKNVILIGHSRGGLISAYLAEYLAREAGINVHAVITIGSPFGGSAFAVQPLSWISKSIEQMEKGCEFLMRLNEKVSESDLFYFHVAAKKDGLVARDSTFVEKNNYTFVLLDRHGHLSIMSSHRLVGLIRLCLSNTCNRLLGIDAVDVDIENLMDNFSFVEEEPQDVSDLAEVCHQIDICIGELKQRNHFKSTESKENALQQLKILLSAMMNGDRGTYYPEAETIGDFIDAYMQDESMGNGLKPMDIIGEPLNYVFLTSLFGQPKSQSQLDIEDLIRNYKDNPLPSALLECQEKRM